MNIGVFFAVAIVTAFSAMYIKQVRPDFALCVTISGVVLIMWGIIPRISIIVSNIRSFKIAGESVSVYLEPMLKTIGISYVAQFASDICQDAGEKALSTQVENIGKAAIAFISLPIVEDVFSIITGLLE